MADQDEIDAFEDQLASLEAAMAETGAVTQAFSSEITKMQGTLAATGREAEVLSKGLSRGLRRAFDGLVFDGMRASDALEAVARSAINTAYGWRHGADGRGRAGGGHAADAWQRRAVGCAVRGRRTAGADRDEHIDARCPEFSAQPVSDRRSDEPRPGTEPAEPMRSCAGLCLSRCAAAALRLFLHILRKMKGWAGALFRIFGQR